MSNQPYINVVLIRDDGHTQSFTCADWIDVNRTVRDTLPTLWAQHSPIAKVFASDGSELVELNIETCRNFETDGGLFPESRNEASS